MAQKKLQKDSEYAHLDIDGDGVVTDDELDLDERMMRLENEDKKEDAQRYMAWFALWGMLIYPIGIVIADIIGYETTGKLLADIAPTYFVAISALVAAFFGADALVKRKK